MKEVKVNELTAEDFPSAVSPFFANVEGRMSLKMACVLASIISYQALCPRLRVKYPYDYGLSMLLCFLLVIGPSGAGKSLIRMVVFTILKHFIERDQRERHKQREQLEENRRKGSQKDKDQELLAIIRFLQSFTLPVIVKYSDFMHRRYGDYLSFFLFGDELASFTENRHNKLDFQAVSRTAYSMGEYYSRDTLYEQGYNAMVDINWNSVICGQEHSLRDYIGGKEAVLGDAGRQILVKLGGGLGDEAPIFHPLTEEQQQAVEDTVKKLMEETFTPDDKLQPTHEVDMSWLDDDVRDWCSQQRITIAKTGSRAHNSFYVRASVSAFRLCTMLYHLWDEQEEHQEKVRRCYWFFAQKILDSQMLQWGERYEAEMGKEKDAQTAKPSLFDSMPETFTREQLQEKIAQQGLGTAARQFIYKWQKNRWIYFDDEQNIYHKMFEV